MILRGLIIEFGIGILYGSDMKDKAPTEVYFESVFVARQPIFDLFGTACGYELLFRNSGESVAAVINNPSLATVCVATCGFVFSQDDFESAKKLFINFTDDLIVQKAPKALPPSYTVIELLENSSLTDEVFSALVELKQLGYTIAIDDYTGADEFEQFIEIADIVKVDVLDQSFEQVEAIARKLGSKKVQLLAEKVETNEEFLKLKELGFTLFQGFYFSKPEMIEGRKISTAESSRLCVLNEIQRPDLDIESVLSIIRKDVTLSYRLLRFLNSAAFNFSVEITSLSQAARLIGEKRLKHWLRLAVISDIGSSLYSEELCNIAITRAVFFEALAELQVASTKKREEMYMFGLFSMLDALLNISMSEVVKYLPLNNEFKLGLTSGDEVLNSYIQLVSAIERADWESVMVFSRQLNISSEDIQSVYFDSLQEAARLNAALN